MSNYLLMVWIAAGILCFAPLFVKNRYLQFLVVPVIMTAVLYSFIYSDQQIGRPYYDHPEKFLYVSHKVDEIEGKKWITLLAIVDEDDRLYRFPYTDKKQQELKSAQQRSKNGRAQVGEFNPRDPRNGERTAEPELKTYDLPHTEIIPKDK